ncbi:uncharacterized protein LOC123545831 [Mercenaria mercenaria]|uniref:uncharacterized protein LOC123545831 n=1 Tax=Mercenaria mercenaria TaxID=6596 RepID=UPI001E1D91FB|nr:uncharacterized protein LOC123545831 [Mercenaria mercenaria]
MSVNVLPDMDEPRLKALGKQLNRNRKSSIISTGKMKDNLDVYVKSLNKAQKSLDGKFHVRSTRLKKNLARVRGTQKVLKSRREQSFWEDSEEYPYGVYNGEKLDSLRREVDNVIERKHPKYRRQKKVEQHLRDGKSMGKILEEDDAKMQFNMIMSKDRKNPYLKRENPLTRTFFHRAVPNRIEAFLDNLQVAKKVQHERQNVEKLDITTSKKQSENDLVQHSRTPNLRVEQLRLNDIESPNDSGVCTPSEYSEEDVFTAPSPVHFSLPPITAKKEFVTKNRLKEKSNLTLPNLSVRRATKGDISAINTDRMKNDRLKSRRATTFMF